MKIRVLAYALILLSIASFNEACSNEKESQKPTIVTSTIVKITESSAASGGWISSDNGSPIIDRGICWSIEPNPILEDNIIYDNGTGTGAFEVNLTKLNANTTYYVRAFATNKVGTSYGDEQVFTTLAEIPKACFEITSNVGLKVTFTNCSEYPTSCLWDFGDGSSSTEMVPTHVYNTIGTFAVKLTIYKDGISNFINKNVVVTGYVDLKAIMVPNLIQYPSPSPLYLDVDFDGLNDFSFSSGSMSSPISGTYNLWSSLKALNNFEVYYDSITVATVHRDVSPNTTTYSNQLSPTIFVNGNTIYSTGRATSANAFTLGTYITSSNGSNSFVSRWNSDETHYIGFRKTDQGKTKIGWIKLMVQNYSEVTIFGFMAPIESESRNCK